jgi:mono/diheme cytochrome c family protein
VTQKGFPRSPPLRSPRHSPEAIVDIISNGKGAMPALAEQVSPERRWAIAYYLARGGDCDL